MWIPLGGVVRYAGPCKREGCPDYSQGPGTEFEVLAKSLGLNPNEGCGCASIKLRMNHLGVAGCIENRSDLLESLRQNEATFSWLATAIAAGNAARSGLALKISWTDPLPDLLDLAIENARLKNSEETLKECCDGSCDNKTSDPPKALDT
jgi:hypothetical protein